VQRGRDLQLPQQRSEPIRRIRASYTLFLEQIDACQEQYFHYFRMAFRTSVGERRTTILCRLSHSSSCSLAFIRSSTHIISSFYICFRIQKSLHHINAIPSTGILESGPSHLQNLKQVTTSYLPPTLKHHTRSRASMSAPDSKSKDTTAT
jgi:hypothetical protein